MGFYKFGTEDKSVTLVSDCGEQFTGVSEEDVDFQQHNYLLAIDPAYADRHEIELEKDYTYELIVTNDCDVAMTSLVGCYGEFPRKHGNYFSISHKGRLFPVVNMWKENYEEARKRFASDNTLELIIINSVVIVRDKRIPKEWKLKKLFLKYNVDRVMSFTERMKLQEFYKQNCGLV